MSLRARLRELGHTLGPRYRVVETTCDRCGLQQFVLVPEKCEAKCAGCSAVVIDQPNTVKVAP